MNRESVAQFVILAAVVLVLLPLFVAAAAMASHFVFGMTGMTGAFAVGGVQAVALGWAALAIIIVGALITLVVGEFRHA
ncbi:MAG: hypothetical protein FJW14_02335 [Acidimicrobiia bacterium]|nr:hypothetical protein [Acidimicrobiia bacterium]